MAANNSAMDAFFGKDVFAIVASLVGVAMVALLVSNAKGATSIIESAGGTFNEMLQTVTLQNRYGNPFAH